MKVADLEQFLNEIASPALAESYDNVGLQVGDRNANVLGVLINLEITESVINEAIEMGANVIIVHHPLIFSPIKKLTSGSFINDLLIKLVQNNIALFAIHTNLDNVKHGVNKKIADKIGLTNLEILQKKSNNLFQLVTYVPETHLDEVLNALFHAGAGKIGNYDECSFTGKGLGTYRPLEGSKPFLGEKNQRSNEEETKIELVFPSHLRRSVEKALLKSNPYEEVAYQIFETKNSVRDIGSGMIGELSEEMKKEDFLKHLHNTFQCGAIRYADSNKKMIKKVAICGGSCSFLIGAAKNAKADAFVTGDITYHKFFDGNGKLLLCDIGHYESEQYTSELLFENISKKFPNLAVYLSKINTNPVKYYYGERNN